MQETIAAQQAEIATLKDAIPSTNSGQQSMNDDILTITNISTVLSAHNDSVTCLATDGTNIYSGSADTSVIVWTVADGVLTAQHTLSHRYHVRDAHVIPDQGILVTAASLESTNRKYVYPHDHREDCLADIIF